MIENQRPKILFDILSIIMITYVYPTAAETSRSLIRHLIALMAAAPDRIFHIAFSGGNTPSLMFDLWAREFCDITPWSRMRIYWVDERCVPAEFPESNYGTMRRLLLNKVAIPAEYIFPINGDNRPEGEAVRYSRLVCCNVPHDGTLPAFDVVLLGVGEDGHTSSIFPGQERLLSSSRPYELSVNPYNGSKRIAMTGCLLFNARRLIFLVTGSSKSEVMRDVLAGEDVGPAAYVAHHAKRVEIFMDELAKPQLGGPEVKV